MDAETELAALGHVFVADLLLDRAGDLEVVEAFAGGGVDLEQLGGDDRAGEVVGHELADLAALDHVLADLFESGRRGLEVGRDHGAAREAVLDDLDEAHVGREERGDGGAVDAGQEEDLVGDLLERVEKLGLEDVVVFDGERDDDAVGVAEGRLVLDEGLDVRVLGRELLEEAGVDVGARGEERHDQREGREQAQGRAAAGEDQRLEGAGETVSEGHGAEAAGKRARGRALGFELPTSNFELPTSNFERK